MTTSTHSDDPLIGRLIDGRYQVRSRIARGGMATVYLATDLRLERKVAIKVMHSHLADDQSFAQRFIQEARSAARLAHPNVVNVFDQGEDSGMAYMVMEYLPGITLRDLLRDFSKLTPAQTLDILDSVLAGLAAAHQAGIIHRDIKPENVMLADDGRIKLADFGLARAVSAHTDAGQALLGTIAYLSPELVSRGVADARSDVYAVGIMLYEMLTGEQPYVGDDAVHIAYQHTNEQVPAPSSKVAGVPRAFDELVAWATQRQPEDRPADAGVLLAKLREFEQSPDGLDNATVVMPRATVAMALADAGTGAAAAASSDADETVAFRSDLLPGSDDPQLAHLSPEERAAYLSRRKQVRRNRLVAILIALALIVAGTGGWWMLFGPGSYVEVPVTSGLAPDQAIQDLEKAGFTTATVETNSAEVAAGLVIDTDPPAGSRQPKNTLVTVKVSIGPSLIDFPTVKGLTETAASELLESFTLEPSVTEFAGDVPNGQVIRATDPNGTEIGATYPEKAPVVLVISIGPVPDVTGQPLASAQSKLEAVGLVVVVESEQFNDSIPAGSVVSATPAATPVRPGVTMNLIVSKGPELVAVPNVAGRPMREAIKTLQNAGFDVDYAINEQFVDYATVASTNPAGGSMARKGSTVTIKARIEL